jgi:hypothetical protein
VSVRASTAVWDYSQAPDHTVLVCLLALADNCDHDGLCTLSIAALAKQARVGRSTFYRSLQVAEKLGEIDRTYKGGGGPGDLSTYRLRLVENVAREASQKRPKSVPLLGHKTLETLDTKASPRDPVENIPPAVPPEEVRARVTEIRRHLLAPRHRDQ